MCLDNKHHWLWMVICWRWDKKWEFSRGDTELCFAFVITSCQARSAGDARWNTRLNRGKQSPGRQTDLQLICIKIAPGHVWGEEGTWRSDPQREYSQKQHSIPPNYRRDYGKYPQKGWCKELGWWLQRQGTVQSQGNTNCERRGKDSSALPLRNTWQRLQPLIKNLYFKLAEAVFSC